MKKIIYFINILLLSILLFSCNDKITVTFDAGANYKFDSLLIKKGEAIGNIEEPTKEGYIFRNWTLNNNDFTLDTIINEDITLVAKWDLANYSIIFFDDNTKLDIDKTYNIEQEINLDDFNKPGYKFKGWYSNKDLTGDVVTKIEIGSYGDKILYGKWELNEDINTYIVTFNSNGGNSINNQAVEENNLVIKPNNPTKEGYTFLGWFKDENFNYVWDFDTDKVTSNITLYAKWEKNNSQIEDSFTETFDNAENKGSSYIDGNFTGVNDIYWEYNKARFDQSIDGPCITFKGTDGFLKANITGGITKLIFDYNKPFSSPGSVEVFINGNSYGSFSDTGKAVINDINVTGEYLLEIKSTSDKQISIDSLTIYTSSNADLEEINKAFEEVNKKFPTVVYESGEVLFLGGYNECDVNYTFKDPNNTKNSLIDFENAYITVEEGKSYKIELIVTVTCNKTKVSKDYTIYIGEPILTITEFKNLIDNKEYKVKGTITKFYYDNNNNIYFFLQDDSNGIYAMALSEDYINNIKEGNEVIIKGSKRITNNRIELRNIISIEIINKNKEISSIDNISSLDNYYGKLVTVTGLLLNSNTVIDSNNNEFKFINNNILDLDNIKLGTELTITAPVYLDNGIYYLYLTNLDDIENNGLNKELIKNLVLSKLNLPENNEEISDNLNLVTKSIFDSLITYQSSDENILSNTGVITKTDTTQNVVLNYSIKIDNEEIHSDSISLIISEQNQYDGYYSSLNNLSGSQFNNELKNLIKNTGYQNKGGTENVKETDKYNGSYYLIYTGKGSYGNREHVWPDSKIGEGDNDLHNLRACNEKVNGSRGNDPFTTGSGSYKDLSNAWFPGDEHVGDVARIILYMYLRYEKSISLVGNINMFLLWNEQDPVNDFERVRNDRIHDIQKNRNPFIDHPEFVKMYFGEPQGYYKNEIDTRSYDKVEIKVNKINYIEFNKEKKYFQEGQN